MVTLACTASGDLIQVCLTALFLSLTGMKGRLLLHYPIYV